MFKYPQKMKTKKHKAIKTFLFTFFFLFLVKLYKKILFLRIKTYCTRKFKNCRKIRVISKRNSAGSFVQRHYISPFWKHTMISFHSTFVTTEIKGREGGWKFVLSSSPFLLLWKRQTEQKIVTYNI